MKICVKFKKLNDKAVAPKKAHEDDFCYDLVATSKEEIAPNVFKYGTGLALQVDMDEMYRYFYDYHFSFDVRPRSSIWKTGLVLSNSVGTIDEGYTGEISAVFYKVSEGTPYEVGDRIGQLCLNMTTDLVFYETDELNETDRGSGGYGSTGK